jgi:hypothetical protein
MIETFKKLTVNQYEAAFCTLNMCMERCPDFAWHRPVHQLALCQVVFHTLFYADYYLGENEDAFRKQPYHRANEAFFGDYEELRDCKPQTLYDKAGLRSYMQHCRTKASAVLAAATASSVCSPCGFARRDFSRAELHLYNIRHIQHHAAQLILRLRIDTNQDFPWIGSGWREL